MPLATSARQRANAGPRHFGILRDCMPDTPMAPTTPTIHQQREPALKRGDPFHREHPRPGSAFRDHILNAFVGPTEFRRGLGLGLGDRYAAELRLIDSVAASTR